MPIIRVFEGVVRIATTKEPGVRQTVRTMDVLCNDRTVRMAVVGAAGLCLGLGGCNVDSFMDPSVTGRWEYTPTTFPILTYISTVESKPEDLVDYSAVSASDLLPNPADYRLGPGDRLQFKLWDIVEQGRVETYERQVDIRGLVDIPQLGRFYVNGRNVPQVREMLSEKMKAFVSEPLVEIDVTELRQQTFAIIGGVSRPGAYFIPRPDYRLLEAITNGERLDTTAKQLYVIRTVNLDPMLDNPSGAPPSDAIQPTGVPGTSGTRPADKQGADILELINSISGENTPAKKPDAPMPGAISGNSGRDVPSSMQPGSSSGKEPAVPLPEMVTIPTATQPRVAVQAGAPWKFVNGKWVQVGSSSARAVGPAEAVGLTDDGRAPGDVVTQRVIKIPMDRLLAGDSTLNIIIRPGDVIRIPEPERGVFYVGGQVRRGGVFELPTDGKMTLKRAIDTAGGLDQLAIPEKVDIIRMIGKDRQAIVKVNLGAINRGTQPDLYIKPDDQISVGTNFWAQPLAVLRNGLRANYGFGFLLDRNFGTDLLGVPPEFKNRARSNLPF